MANQQDYELVRPLSESSSHIHLGYRKTLLSSSDMVIPLICGICLHLFYMTLLLPILVLYYDDYNNLKQCMNTHFEIYLILALLIHTFTLITNILSTIIAFQTKVLNTSKWLNILLSIRLLLNIFEIFTIIYGFIVTFINQQNIHCFHNHSTDEILYILIAFNLLSNLSIVLLTWLILFCCCTKSDSIGNRNDIIQSQQTYNSLLHKYCSICFYDQKSPKLSQTFNEMGGLITILMRGNPYDHLELTPSDIITGLHLLRMLQKHYGEFDEKFYFPYDRNRNELNNSEMNELNELKYYTLYANAAYGIGLYTLSKPCAICCSPPCFLPYKMDINNILYRNNKCCCDNIQLDNSNLKVFIERTNISINDLLLIQQIGDLNKVNFYVSIDYNKQSLIISLRGSMSIQDSITDIQCQPMHFPQIHNNCYVHSGIGKCAKYVFDIIINNQKIIHFLKNNPLFNVILVGHSLGAGVCVLLSLMFKYGTKHKNLKYFINDKHKFKAYAIAPPSVIERDFILKRNEEISKFLICVIYGYDIVPRLSFNGVIFTRAAINRLLYQCVQTPWWIYEKSITMKYNTIVNALKHDTKYLKNYIASEIKNDMDENKYENDNNNNGLPGQEYFVNEILKDIKNMEKKAIECNLSKPELWNTKFCQCGYIFHIVNDNQKELNKKFEHKIDMNENDDIKNNLMRNETYESMECIKNICKTIWKSVVCNVLKGRICLDEHDTKYYVYRANPDAFCDKMLISPYLLADHMPQVYLNVLQNMTL